MTVASMVAKTQVEPQAVVARAQDEMIGQLWAEASMKNFCAQSHVRNCVCLKVSRAGEHDCNKDDEWVVVSETAKGGTKGTQHAMAESAVGKASSKSFSSVRCEHGGKDDMGLQPPRQHKHKEGRCEWQQQ